MPIYTQYCGPFGAAQSKTNLERGKLSVLDLAVIVATLEGMNLVKQRWVRLQ
jgi:hypothetical protein